jgi:hypothetical protein
MGFNKRKMEDARRQEAEKGAACRRYRVAPAGRLAADAAAYSGLVLS